MQLRTPIAVGAFAAHSRRDATATLGAGICAKFLGEHRPELRYPSPHRFVGDIQPTLCEQIFDVAIAESETEIEPNGVPDDRRRKLMAGKRDRHAPSYPSNGSAPSLP